MVGQKAIVERTIHETIKKAQMNMSIGYMKKLEFELGNLVVNSIRRAKANGRRTVMERDL